MLSLGLEQRRRGGTEVEHLQKQSTGAWQAHQSRRHPSHDHGMNIRQKISQWEGRTQQCSNWNAGVKAHPPVVSRSLSGDVLDNGFRIEKSKGSHQTTVFKAKSLGLDFREVGSKLEPLKNHSTITPGSKQPVASIFASPKMEANTAKPKQTSTANGDKMINNILDVEVVSKPLPLSTDDQEDCMPAGNFYTSRGFWRWLEGDKLFWEKGRRSSGEVPPPTKPQRTFLYQGSDNNTRQTIRWDSPANHSNHSNKKSTKIAQPPNFPPPPCPGVKSEGLSRHKKSRKSFEYEDAVTAKQSILGVEKGHSALYHAYSEDNIYEDIICDVTRENPYEDVRLSPMCLPVGRPHAPKLPPKPQVLQGYTSKAEKDSRTFISSKSLTSANTPKPTTFWHVNTQKVQPRFVNKIETIFDDKRGRKRVRGQGVSMREETSGTESDPEDAKARSRRSVYIHSSLKRRPGYKTLEKDLIQLQQQQLFQMFVVVSLKKDAQGNAYSPEITQQFPKWSEFDSTSRLSREAEDQLKVIPKFCFPDCEDWKPSAHVPSETFSFVLTGEDGSRWFCYCRKILPSGKGKQLPEVHCVVSKLGCFNLFAKILEEVERRREISPALVYPFMRSVMEAPFPAPGRTVTVKIFLPGSGNEVLTLCRPEDSRLEHVDFDTLLQCLSVGNLLQVFASLLLERRVIMVADKLSVLSRCGHAALALLYPFTWQHTFVPVLPASMLDISCSPTPFLIGVLAPCLPQLLELPIEEVLIVDLCTDRLVVQLGDEDCILPSKLHAALQQVLDERKDILAQGDADGDQQADLSSLVSEAFVRFFIELVGHYPHHMVESSGGNREFQRDSFRKSHPSRGVRQFLQLFMDTQMFAGFVQDKELRKGGGKGLFETRVTEYLDSCPELEPSSVNKFFKGLGSKMKFLQIK
ncbi:DENN domain-containing protein 2C [Thalassophryne amazonica]|uniref:DENN domain-containing protein 2C n=1 Tax=Thalassophryne amazonica TaxID=390379 RepID=UPI0014725AB5|nr:DENN domain-containing protein 2C [Thalassophryne amazonica]